MYQWIGGGDRQGPIFLGSLEDFINPENPVRFLDLFVNSLDLKALGFKFPKESSLGGAPAYHPGDLLKLYLYGYGQQIRSSRRLEKECQRNIEVMWLVGRIAPDHKTISDFRKNNAEAFEAVAREFNRLCRELDLYGAELIALDGGKFKALNAQDKNYSQTKLKKQINLNQERIVRYLKELDESDALEEAGPLPTRAPSKEELQEKLQRARSKTEELERQLGELEKSQESQRSETDPDSRAMGKGKRSLVGYNVQASVDAKHHLLIDVKATNAVNDSGLLASGIMRAQAALGVKEIEAVADKGYYSRVDLKASHEAGAEVYVQSIELSQSERLGLYGKEDFRYLPETDSYQCPANANLKLRRTSRVRGELQVYEYDNPKACRSCLLKSRCTKSPSRIVSRWEHEETVERVREKVRENPEKVAKRKTLIEHCIGTLKWLLPGGFLVKTLRKVGAEVSLAHFAYNFKRAMSVVGLASLLAKAS